MTSSTDILLCTDMDRTIVPNGDQDESPSARRILHLLVERPELRLAYVSGRDKRLILDAIEHYGLPLPDYAVGDVGTSIYEVRDGDWRPSTAWLEEIDKDWRGLRREDLAAMLRDLHALTLQESEKQSRFKLSYYADARVDRHALVDEVYRRLSREGLRCRIVWSVDEQRHLGLVDVLPERASKRHAIDYLVKREGYVRSRVVFCGDSGNDLDVLTSGIQSVLVRNASDEVRREALQRVSREGFSETLYVAQGDFMGMNGNYAAGVLEGLAHYVPDVKPWMEAIASRLGTP